MAEQLLSATADLTSATLRRPFNRGYLSSLWSHLFSSLLRVTPSTSSLLLTEPLFNLPSIQRSTDEIVFEEFGFRSLFVADSPSLVHLYEAQPDLALGLSSHSDPGGMTILLPDQHVPGPQVRKDHSWITVKPAPHAFIVNIGDQIQTIQLGLLPLCSYTCAYGLVSKAQCSLVVDCGFSFTHWAPVFQNFTVNYGVKRMDLGGQALTTYLKEIVSYRSVNVMDESFFMDDVKEKLCFVSLDVAQDLKVSR
ncbi:hypothetical protein RJ640_025386 [Escallonia rubra]|uniref:Fe2OG dioxygenase domain-containing protein n=1 Tax=Escallonia rubra TaxID=112253 RepID=A0AA88S9Z0_9ASTE|nr:hypothetical protein RJ640_025386 [Escallonia rubra]